MDLDKLKTFYFIARIGNFSKAAERLGVSQSCLSRQILTLEKDLGLKVFIRSQKGLKLTKEGEVLFASTARILEELEGAFAIIQDEQGIPQGPIRISTTFSLANQLLIYHMPEFLKKYPKINVSIYGNDITHDFTTREVDVALRPRIPERVDLIQEFIMASPLQLFASKQYLEEFGMPKKPSDLDKHRLIAHGGLVGLPLRDIDWHLGLGASGHERKPYFEINSGMGGRIAAELGFGIVTLSADHPIPENSNLVRVLPDVEGPLVETYYIYPKHLADSRRIEVFGEFIKDSLTKDVLKPSSL